MTTSRIAANARPTRRRFLQGASAAALAAASVSFAGAARAAAKPLVALVHTQAAGDAGPIDDMIRYLKQIEAEKNVEIRTIYAQDAATFESIFRNLGDAGAAIVITTFFAVAEPLKAVAPAYPKTLFIQLYADPVDPPIANLQTVGYDEYLAAYLSGILGARLSRSGKLGYIAGVSVPSLNADYNALKDGAVAVRPDITVTPAFVGSFQDPGKAQEIAGQMYGSGIDFIQCDSAGSNLGIIQSANEGDGRFVIGTSLDTLALGPKTMPATIVIGFGKSLYNQVAAALDGSFKAGHYLANLADGVIDFLVSDEFLKSGPADAVAKVKETWPEIEKAKADIVAGTLKVAFKTEI
jgi:basic membrane protein A